MTARPRLPKAGTPAPAFTLPDHTGRAISLGDFTGRPVVLYFYPKDATPGCTTQACGLRDAWRDVQATGAVVLGVSPDGIASHAAFRREQGLPFALLADEDRAVARRYGVWGEKTLFGVKYHGILRTTFVIDGRGMIHHVFERVKPKGHAAQVLDVLHELTD